MIWKSLAVAVAALGAATALSVVTALGVGSFDCPLFPQCRTPPRRIIDSQSWSVLIPETATLQDHENSDSNLLKGTHLPTSIVTTSCGGHVTVTLTGLVMPNTGEREVSASVTDEATNLVRASAYVNGTLVTTATVENGGITLREGRAEASLAFLVPPAGESLEVELRRSFSDGKSASDSVSTAYGWATGLRLREMQVRRWLREAVHSFTP